LASQHHTEEDHGIWRASRVLFGTQLALNALWSYVFFGRRAPGWALLETLFLWVVITATMLVFFKVFRTAALIVATLVAEQFCGGLESLDLASKQIVHRRYLQT
jgi:tryptophan-rich sensory protein